MAKRKFYKKTLKNTLKIFKALKNEEKKGNTFLTVSKLSKICNIHKWTVSRTLDLYMQPVVDVTVPEGFEDIGMPMKIVRLKNPEMDIEQLLRFLKLRSRME